MGAVVRETGSPIILYGCHGGGAQEITYDSTARIFYRAEDNRCLDRTGVEDGGRVRLVSCNLRLEEQRWWLEDLEGVKEWVDEV